MAQIVHTHFSFVSADAKNSRLTVFLYLALTVLFCVGALFLFGPAIRNLPVGFGLVGAGVALIVYMIKFAQKTNVTVSLLQATVALPQR